MARLSNQFKDFLYAVVFIGLFFLLLGHASDVCADDVGNDYVADALEYASYTAIVADWAQTLQIRERDDIYEKNDWLYGKQPSRGRVNLIMALQLYGVWYANRTLADSHRRAFNGVVFSTRLVVVKQNLELGLEVKF